MLPKSKIRLSSSSIGMFFVCPYGFYLSSVKGIPTIPTKPMMEGTATHEVLAKFYEKDFYTKEELLERIKILCQQYPEMTQKLLNFEAFNLQKMNHCSKEDFVPIMREQKMVGSFDSEVDISGVIDRVDKIGDKFVVVDYKTGSPNSMENYRDQLAIYDWLLRKTTAIRPTNYGDFFIDFGIFQTEEITSYFEKSVIPKIETIRKAFKENNFPKTKKGCLLGRNCCVNDRDSP